MILCHFSLVLPLFSGLAVFSRPCQVQPNLCRYSQTIVGTAKPLPVQPNHCWYSQTIVGTAKPLWLQPNLANLPLYMVRNSSPHSLALIAERHPIQPPSAPPKFLKNIFYSLKTHLLRVSGYFSLKNGSNSGRNRGVVRNYSQDKRLPNR